MSNLQKASSIQATIRANLGAPASTLIRVPEIEDDPTGDAIRKLQIQIFELADAMAGIVAEIETLQRGKEPRSTRIYP